MADDLGNGLARELSTSAGFTLAVEAIGSVDLEGASHDARPDTGRRDRAESLDPVRLYLRHAARSRLLDREEETIAQRTAGAARVPPPFSGRRSGCAGFSVFPHHCGTGRCGSKMYSSVLPTMARRHQIPR
jgi:hypothetical protein